MPVLLLHSRVDHVVEPVNSQVVRDEISSTDVTDIVLEHSYHVATLDNDAELIFTSSVEFIEKVTASTNAETTNTATTNTEATP